MKPQEELIQADIRQIVSALAEPHRQAWPIPDDIVDVCLKFECLPDFDFFNRLKGIISEAELQQGIRERIEEHSKAIAIASKRHKVSEPLSSHERYGLLHEDGSITIEYRPTKNPHAGRTEFEVITHTVAIAFLEEYFLKGKRAPAPQEANTRKWALYYWYLYMAGYKPELQAGSGKQAALEALAEEHGVSAQKLLQVFNAVGRKKNELNPKKPHILEKVIPMLAEYPEALAMAQKDFQELQKGTKE